MPSIELTRGIFDRSRIAVVRRDGEQLRDPVMEKRFGDVDYDGMQRFRPKRERPPPGHQVK